MIFKKKHPAKRYLYAITGGTYLGELFVFIENNDSTFSFLSLPDMKIRDIPSEKFDFGIENKIIDIVEKLPKSVFEVCKKQYYKNKTVFSGTAV